LKQIFLVLTDWERLGIPLMLFLMKLMLKNNARLSYWGYSSLLLSTMQSTNESYKYGHSQLCIHFWQRVNCLKKKN